MDHFLYRNGQLFAEDVPVAEIAASVGTPVYIYSTATLLRHFGLFDQALAGELAGSAGFSLLCGRYEGIDHRIREHLIDEEISVGDVVLAGGEVGACLVIEAVTRLIPGVMGNAVSPVTESFGQSGILEEPHYTRPAEFRGWEVPEVLRSGDHAKVERWRQAQALHRTIAQRPDLMALRGPLTQAEQRLLEEFPPTPYPSHFTI